MTPNAAPNEGATDANRSGVYAAKNYQALVDEGRITLGAALTETQVQPASLDLTLGKTAYRMRASFLPGGVRSVEERVRAGLLMHEIDLSKGAVLEKGCVYLVKLRESVRLPPDVTGFANPKSSTGRIDVFTRLVTDFASTFDTVAAGYEGPLYAEISPRTFSILVREGSTLNQLRLRRGQPRLNDDELRDLQARDPVVGGEADIADGVALTVNLEGSQGDLVGFRAKRHSSLIDIDKVGVLDPRDYWEPIPTPRSGAIILDPDEFYILASKEWLRIPPDYAAEMIPFNPLLGEFRVHYAGFFDPGFGCKETGGEGGRAVLEVRSHEAPFILEDGQVIGRLIYEKLLERPDRLYGEESGSNYQRQGLKLSKAFKVWGD